MQAELDRGLGGVVFAPGFEAAAHELTGRLGLAVLAEAPEPNAGLVLRLDSDGLSLVSDSMVLRGDFAKLLPRIKLGRLQKELLVRAARVKGIENPRAVDATAGLGEDSFLLAAAGFEVTLFERDAVIAELLDDALTRARGDASCAAIASRMRLVKGDSVQGLAELGFTPDVILLDPMFPARQKRASVKKKLQLIQKLERPCEDESGLFEAARALRPRKLVVKRPAKGPFLAGVKPNYSIAGKAVRYDCFSFAQG